MIFRIVIGDAGPAIVYFGQIVGVGSCLIILRIRRNRKRTGGGIGGGCTHNIAIAVLQLELKVEAAALGSAVLEQGLRAGNVQCRGGRYHAFFRITNNQAAVGHDAAAVGIGAVAGNDDTGHGLSAGDCTFIRIRREAKQIFCCCITGFADGNCRFITASPPVCRAAANHLAGDERDNTAAVLSSHTEIIQVAVVFEHVTFVRNLTVVILSVAAAGHMVSGSGIAVYGRAIFMDDQRLTGGTSAHAAAKATGRVGSNQGIVNIQRSFFLYENAAAAPVVS